MDCIEDVINLDDDDKKWEEDIEKETAEYNKKQLDGYKDFLNFLNEEEVAKKGNIIETITGCDRVDFIGYVDGELSVKNNELKITIEVPDRCGYNGKKTAKIECDWQHADNYGVHQRCDFEDSYYGWMIFPCWNFKRFYCVYYTC